MNLSTRIAARPAGWLTALMLWPAPLAWAHDPVFGPGPHVLYQGGVEIAPEFGLARRGEQRSTGLGLQLTYGLTGDWAAGIELPYAWKRDQAGDSRGPGDIVLFTKYRFWRHDTLGAQESMAVLGRLSTPSGDEDDSPALGTGTADPLLGLAWGYESRKWYRWASIRYRFNNENGAGLERGDRLFLDLAGGIRPVPGGYLEPDTVWLLELNGEYSWRSERHGRDLPDSGGMEWFISPGIFWTLRNFAIKAGVQIPVASDLNGQQQETDYRARLILEWHL